MRSIWILLCAAALSIFSAACGSSSRSTVTKPVHTQDRHRVSPTGGPAELRYRHLYSLSAPLRDPAVATLNNQTFVLLGGLDQADVSTDEVDVADLAHAKQVATLSVAQHDAQGATLSGKVYAFGGGSLSELDHIISFDPANATLTTVGTLPAAESDVAVAAVGNTAYVIGGYDGTNWLDTIVAYSPGSPPRVVGHLPQGLRYAAATSVRDRVVIVGGSTIAGASRSILSFDPGTGAVHQIGVLPEPVTHAGAATVNSYVYLVGGRGDPLNAQTAEVLSIDPQAGSVRAAGQLPLPLSDAAVVTVGKVIVVAGGLTGSGATEADVGELLVGC